MRSVSGRVAKATNSKEAWKFLEAEFGARESDIQQQVMSRAKKSVADLRIDEQACERKIELEECNSKVDDSCQGHKIETHYTSMHMDEEYAAKIAETEFEASVCETKQEHINAQGLHCNVDDTDGESLCGETHVNYDCKVICELVNPIAPNGFGEVEIVNEIDNEHTHARISHHSVDEHYVDIMRGFFLK